MNVLLISPPYRNVYKLVKSASGRTPPINLAYLAAYIRDKGHRVQILDVENLGINISEVEKFLPGNIDVVGVSSMTPSLESSLRILETIKRKKPGCLTVMGGPHITALPEEVMWEAKNLDFGVLGEGEETFAELLDVLSDRPWNEERLSRIKGIVFKCEGRVIITPRRELISDLDSLPMPAYELLNMDMYEQKPHHMWRKKKISLKPYTNLFTSRGCPHSCTFCASNLIWGRKVRYKSPRYVLDEIDILVNKYRIKSLFIGDDTFLTQKDRVIEILRKVIEKQYDLNFCCMARVDEVDKDLLNLLKQANCHLIRFGVESCSQGILDAMKKGYQVEQIKKAFAMCRQAGLSASASIIVGYPGETEESFDFTLRMIREINPDGCEFLIALPIVGTELHTLASQRGYLIKRSWAEWTLLPDKPLIATEHLTPQDLCALRRKGCLSFYFRPTKIWQILRTIRSPQDIKYYLKGLCAIWNLVKNSCYKN